MVVAALERANYAEVGPEYAKLSALLVQQRATEQRAGQPDRPEWTTLAATARAAVTLLDPVVAAARQLAALEPNCELTADAVRNDRPARRSRTT
jgi:hypothetical protein